MKANLKLIGIVLLTFIISLSSCKKDTEKPLQELLPGKWERQSAFYEYFENGVKTGEQGDTFESNEWVYEFLKDGNGSIYEMGTFRDSLSWTLISTSLTIISPNDFTEGEISIENGILTLEGTDSFVSNGVNYESRKLIIFKKL